MCPGFTSASRLAVGPDGHLPRHLYDPTDRIQVAPRLDIERAKFKDVYFVSMKCDDPITPDEREALVANLTALLLKQL